MITGKDHHLGLAGQPTERGRVHDPVAVRSKQVRSASGSSSLARFPPPRARVAPGPQPYGLPLLPQLTGYHRSGAGQRVRRRVRPRGVGVTVHGPSSPLLRSGRDVPRVRRLESRRVSHRRSRARRGQLEIHRQRIVQPVLGRATFVRGEPCRPRGTPARQSGTARPGPVVPAPSRDR